MEKKSLKKKKKIVKNSFISKTEKLNFTYRMPFEDKPN